MNLLVDEPAVPGNPALVASLPPRVPATNSMPALEQELGTLKQQLLLMGSHAESAVNRAIRALLRRDDDLARRTHEDDTVIDKLEVEIDHAVLELLGHGRAAFELRLLTGVMKIARELERVGDEATTISRRCIELSTEPPLKFQIEMPRLASLSLDMLKDALDAFVSGDAVKARAVIPRDDEVDHLHKELQRTLAARMAEQPGNITRCLQLMVITKSLERIADHATNIAEIVVYLCEGQDIRHAPKRI
jgi:phosphate transport system protein